jgi:hypothetical protein
LFVLALGLFGLRQCGSASGKIGKSGKSGKAVTVEKVGEKVRRSKGKEVERRWESGEVGKEKRREEKIGEKESGPGRRWEVGEVIKWREGRSVFEDGKRGERRRGGEKVDGEKNGMWKEVAWCEEVNN